MKIEDLNFDGHFEILGLGLGRSTKCDKSMGELMLWQETRVERPFGFVCTNWAIGTVPPGSFSSAGSYLKLWVLLRLTMLYN